MGLNIFFSLEISNHRVPEQVSGAPPHSERGRRPPVINPVQHHQIRVQRHELVVVVVPVAGGGREVGHGPHLGVGGAAVPMTCFEGGKCRRFEIDFFCGRVFAAGPG